MQYLMTVCCSVEWKGQDAARMDRVCVVQSITLKTVELLIVVSSSYPPQGHHLDGVDLTGEIKYCLPDSAAATAQVRMRWLWMSMGPPPFTVCHFLPISGLAKVTQRPARSCSGVCCFDFADHFLQIMIILKCCYATFGHICTFHRYTSTRFDALLCRLRFAVSQEGPVRKMFTLPGPSSTGHTSTVCCPLWGSFCHPSAGSAGRVLLSFDGWGAPRRAQAQDGDCSLLAAKRGLKELFALWW